MRGIIAFLLLLMSSVIGMASDTGLFTYDGGFFIKSGNTWKEYRPKDKPGVWATYTQYNEENNYYNINNSSVH